MLNILFMFQVVVLWFLDSVYKDEGLKGSSCCFVVSGFCVLKISDREVPVAVLLFLASVY